MRQEILEKSLKESLEKLLTEFLEAVLKRFPEGDFEGISEKCDFHEEPLEEGTCWSISRRTPVGKKEFPKESLEETLLQFF